MTDHELHVRTHVGRDLLQAAQLFRSPEAAIWEYVANSLEYVAAGVRPEITVRIERGTKITISDNGRGMDLEALQHYFTMHAENLERRRGRPGRGKFGTGKSAAFGIANRLEVATVHNGRRNVVAITRDDIDSSDGDLIPIAFLEREQPTDAPTGTVVTIDRLFVNRLRPNDVIRTIERHLVFWRAGEPIVVVDTHVCEPTVPVAVATETIAPNEGERRLLGDVKLTVHTAARPLDAGLFGVAVTTGPGALVAIATGGIDSKEFGQYLFGEIECPALDSGDYPMAAYDSSRSLELNAQHPVAAALLAFVGRTLDRVRQGLVEEHRRKRQEREFKELEKEANKIAQLLNEDLSSVRERFEEIAKLQKRGTSVARAGSAVGGDDPTTFVGGDDEPGLLDAPTEREAADPRNDTDRDPPDIAQRGEQSQDGPDRVKPAGGTGGKRRPQGGLVVEYRELGEDEDRGNYSIGERAILINLDHPMVAAAKEAGDGIHDIAFTRVSYEIAFTQYALALTQELYNKDPTLDGSDILFEMRDALSRITRKAASLYAKT